MTFEKMVIIVLISIYCICAIASYILGIIVLVNTLKTNKKIKSKTIDYKTLADEYNDIAAKSFERCDNVIYNQIMNDIKSYSKKGHFDIQYDDDEFGLSKYSYVLRHKKQFQDNGFKVSRFFGIVTISWEKKRSKGE